MAPGSISETVQLRNSVQIPRLGFGVYKSPPDLCVQSCLYALRCGYRHIDTAQFYANESQVGAALQKSGLPRSAVFLTTKILSAAGTVETSYQQCLGSLDKLDPVNHYVDLFLIHSPNSGAEKRKEMWLALEKLYKEGKARSIGVSNFGIQHIEEMKQYAEVWPPQVNQIELHPWCQQMETVEYCKKYQIAVEAYCPIVRNTKVDNPALKRLAETHGVTGSQVLIKWSLQKGYIPLPKSDTPKRIESNADLYEFELSNEDIKSLDDLDQGRAGAIVQPVDN